MTVGHLAYRGFGPVSVAGLLNGGAHTLHPAGGGGQLSIQKIFGSMFAGMPSLPETLQSQRYTRDVLGQYGFSPRSMARCESEPYGHFAGPSRSHSQPTKPKASMKEVGTLTRNEALSLLRLANESDPKNIRINFNQEKKKLLPENYEALSTPEKLKAEQAAGRPLAQLVEAAEILKGHKKPLPE